MFRLNNKGQTLVLFVILFPIFIFIMAIVYDIGSLYYEKERLDNICYMTIDYGLDLNGEVEENDLIDLVMKNITDLNDITVLIDDENTITISLNKNVKGLFGTILNINTTQVVSEYRGSIVNNRKVIERVE